MKKPIPKKASIDGHNWSKDANEKINGAFRSAFKGPDGQAVLEYLRAITIEMALPPTADFGQLSHHEGMRRLVMIIEQRRSSEPEKM